MVGSNKKSQIILLLKLVLKSKDGFYNKTYLDGIDLVVLTNKFDTVVSIFVGNVFDMFLSFSVETFFLCFLLALRNKSTKFTAVTSEGIDIGTVVSVFRVVTSTFD